MTKDALRILLISPYCPSTGWGFGTRVYQLARELCLRHSVTVLTYVQPDEDAAELRELGVDVRLISRVPPTRRRRRLAQATSLLAPQPFHYRSLQSSAMQRAIDEVLGEGRFDIVQLESSQLCGLSLDRDTYARLILDEHNIEYELLRRIAGSERQPLRRFFNSVECLKCRRMELGLWARVSGCAFTSEREASIARRHAPSTPTVVVPNGVDLRYFAPPSLPEDPDSIIFAGLLTYRPNLDAARWLVGEILPRIRLARPNAVLTIVGYGESRDLASLKAPGVIVEGWVPDVRPHLARAAVEVVPVRMGSGTRLKVIEGLAMAKAVVSTSLGCEGLSVRDGQHLLVATESDAFAYSVIRLLGDRPLARRLGDAGRRLAERDYSWARSCSRLEDLYETVMAAEALPRLGVA